MQQAIPAVTRRSSLNKNLKLTTAPTYRGLPVYQRKGPLVLDYLEAAFHTIQRSLAAYPRTLAVRVDLRLPSIPHPWWAGNESKLMKRFFAALKSKIKHDRRRAKMDNPGAHDSAVRYVWAREQDSGMHPHFHVLLLLNRDAYYFLGDIRSAEENLANRIAAAWMSALGMSWSKGHALVHFPAEGVYRIDRDDWSGLEKLFYRVSYFTKEVTKPYQKYLHAFDKSRI